MMEEDLKLAQALARLDTPSNRSSSRNHQSSQSDNSANSGDISEDGSSSIKTHASLVLDKVQGFR